MANGRVAMPSAVTITSYPFPQPPLVSSFISGFAAVNIANFVQVSAGVRVRVRVRVRYRVRVRVRTMVASVTYYNDNCCM